MNNSDKIYFLSMVKENKDLIFGAFDGSNITMEKKKEAWSDIVVNLRARGVTVKDAVYLRDTTWANLKRAAIAKFDHNNKTGASRKQLSEVDEMVLDIIDKKSPMAIGLQVRESGCPPPQVQSTSTFFPSGSSSGSSNKQEVVKRKTQKRCQTKDEAIAEYFRWKTKKVKMEVKLLKRELEEKDMSDVSDDEF